MIETLLPAAVEMVIGMHETDGTSPHSTMYSDQIDALHVLSSGVNHSHLFSEAIQHPNRGA